MGRPFDNTVYLYSSFTSFLVCSRGLRHAQRTSGSSTHARSSGSAWCCPAAEGATSNLRWGHRAVKATPDHACTAPRTERRADSPAPEALAPSQRFQLFQCRSWRAPSFAADIQTYVSYKSKTAARSSRFVPLEDHQYRIPTTGSSIVNKRSIESVISPLTIM
jgi:hypothetical protein